MSVVRLVLDTNAAVSGLLWHGNPGKLIDAAQAGSAILYTTAPLLAELHGVLGREKFGKSLVRHVHDLGFLDERMMVIHAIWIDDADVALLAAARCTVV